MLWEWQYLGETLKASDLLLNHFNVFLKQVKKSVKKVKIIILIGAEPLIVYKSLRSPSSFVVHWWLMPLWRKPCEMWFWMQFSVLATSKLKYLFELPVWGLGSFMRFKVCSVYLEWNHKISPKPSLLYVFPDLDKGLKQLPCRKSFF